MSSSAPPPPPAALHVVGAAILRRGRCLAARRGAAMREPLRWEFPGGKVEPGETPRQALAREIAEELALEIEIGRWLGRGRAEVAGGRELVLDVYLARPTGGAVRLAEHASYGWFTAAELAELDWAAADVPILEPLREALRAAQDRRA